jgi:hypothetical protein
MGLQNLDRAKLKLILQTSQGMPGQSPVAKARIASDGKLRPGRTGHALGNHVQGATSAPYIADQARYKTKFRSLDAMAEALERLLATPAGQQALASLRPAQRQTVAQDLRPVFEVEALVELVPAIRVTFTPSDMARARMLHTHVVAVLEGRDRNGELHLHVQTCYPKLDPTQIERLLDAKTST